MLVHETVAGAQSKVKQIFGRIGFGTITGANAYKEFELGYARPFSTNFFTMPDNTPRRSCKVLRKRTLTGRASETRSTMKEWGNVFEWV